MVVSSRICPTIRCYRHICWLQSTSSHRAKWLVWLLGVDIHWGTTSGRRQVPLYKINNWNQKICLVDNLPRTNNSVEGWHHAFQSMIGSHHSQIFSFIGHILKEQGIIDVVKNIFWCGLRIRSLVQQYSTTPRIEYLAGIQQNLTTSMWEHYNGCVELNQIFEFWRSFIKWFIKWTKIKLISSEWTERD